MSEYKCSKCGETCYSKCIGQRNSFPSDETVCLIRSLLTIDFETRVEQEDFIQREMTLGFTVNGSNKDDAEDLERFIKLMRQLTPQQFKILCCKHKWELLSERCSLGCCERKQ